MPKRFKSGETVPLSGIYRVKHSEHRLPGEITLIEGQQFPGCANCSNPVQFSEIRPVDLADRREQIVLYVLPEVTDGAASDATLNGPADPPAMPAVTDPPLAANPKPQRKLRAKAQRRGES